MRLQSISGTVLVALTVGLALAGKTLAGTDETRRPLVGLEGIAVVVEGVTAEAETDGLTKDAIKTDMELKLRLAGIKVLTEEEARKMAGDPLLRVRLVLHKRLGFYRFISRIDCTQQAVLARDKRTAVDAVTWSSTTETGELMFNKLKEGVHKTVLHQVDEFMNDYLAANTKKE